MLLRRADVPSDLTVLAYSADEDLVDHQRLPDSDLVKAIHTYTSDFYSAATHHKDKHDFRSMDESALLSMGILMEEAVAELLGENGDMVFVEPGGLDSAIPERDEVKIQVQGRVNPIATPPYISSQEEDSDRAHKPKKRLKYSSEWMEERLGRS